MPTTEAEELTVETPFDEPEIAPSYPETATKNRPEKAKRFPIPVRKALAPEKAFPWIKTLPQFAIDRMELTVYRDWPVLDHTRTMTPEQLEQYRKSPRRFPKYIDKLGEPFQSDDWKKEILRRWGSGDYRFYLNDSAPANLKGTRGKAEWGDREILRTKVSNLRDGEFPPVVDLRILDMSDKANDSYKRDLMLRGTLTPDEQLTGKKSEEDDMANAAAAESVQTLASALVEATKQRKPENGDSKVIEIMERRLQESEDRHKREMAEMKDQLKQRPAGAVDPLETTSKILELAKVLVPAPVPPDKSGDAMLQLLIQMRKDDGERNRDDMKRLDEQRKSEREELLKRLESSENRLTEALKQQQANTGDGGFLKALKAFTSVKQELDNVTGGNADGGPWYASLIAEGLDKIPTVVQNVTANLAAISNAQARAAATAGQAAPAPGGTVATSPQPQPQEDPQVNMMKTFARQLHPDLLDALRKNEAGYAFAARFIARYGAPNYQQVLPLGRQGLVGMLQLNPELWGELLQFNMRLEQFIDEFLDAEKVQEAVQMMGRPSPSKVNGSPAKGRTVIDPVTGRAIQTETPAA